MNGLIGFVQHQLRGSRDAFALAMLGLVVGACAAGVSIAFRAAIELPQALLLPVSGFAGLSEGVRFVLPLSAWH